MPLSLIINNKATTKYKSSITELVLDATLSESHEKTAKISEYEVETGAAISDHIVLDPSKLVIEGFITNSPVGILQYGSFVRELSGQASIVQTAYDTLLKMYTDKKPFTVVTGLEVYDNMFFESLLVPVKPEYGQTLRFTSKLKQIRYVSSKTVAIESESIKDDPVGTKDQLQSTKDAGKQVPVTPTDAVADKSSTLYDLVSSAGLF